MDDHNQSTTADQAAADAYAQSLLRTVALEEQQRQLQQPTTHHIFTKKRLIWLAVSVVVTLLLGALISRMFKTPGVPVDTSSPTDRIINTY